MSKVPDILQRSVDLFKSRNTEYGNAYKDHPCLMFHLLGPVELKTPEDYERFMRISAIVGKLNRYAKSFESGGHPDSAADMVVYSAMLQELHE